MTRTPEQAPAQSQGVPVGTERASFREVIAQLGDAQKGAARSAPAYSRFVNRRIGRVLAAAAYRAGISPNGVTAISAAFTFAAVGLVALAPLEAWTGVTVSLLLVVGYAFDSADGQVARLTGRGSSAGEWLDHMVDATKISALPLALLVGLYRHGTDDAWLLVPVANAVVGAVLFFGMILTEQMRRAHGVRSEASTEGRLRHLRALLVLPTDYGVLCLSFMLLGALDVFLVVYAFLTLATAGFLVLAARKWYRELCVLSAA